MNLTGQLQASKTQLLQMHAICVHTGDDNAFLCSQNLVSFRGKVTLIPIRVNVKIRQILKEVKGKIQIN